MKKRVIILTCFALTLALLICSLAGCSFKKVRSSGSSGNLGSATTTYPSQSDSTVNTSEDVDNALISEYDPEAEFQLGDDNLYMAYITKGSTALVGYVIEGLNPYTDYTVRWLIDPAVFMDTYVTFQETIIDGASRNFVSLDPDYIEYPENEWGQRLVSSNSPSVLLDCRADGYTFTSESESSFCILLFFKCTYENADQMNELCKTLENYIIELSYTRELE